MVVIEGSRVVELLTQTEAQESVWLDEDTGVEKLERNGSQNGSLLRARKSNISGDKNPGGRFGLAVG